MATLSPALVLSLSLTLSLSLSGPLTLTLTPAHSFSDVHIPTHTHTYAETGVCSRGRCEGKVEGGCSVFWLWCFRVSLDGLKSLMMSYDRHLKHGLFIDVS